MLQRFIASLLWVFAFDMTQIPINGTPARRSYYKEMVHHENSLYLFGGIDGNRQFINQIAQFHLDNKKWEKITPASSQSPRGRSVFSMFKSTEGIWISGGYSEYGKLDDIWMYSPIAKTWTEMPQYGERPPPYYGPGFTEFDFDGGTYFAIAWFGTYTASGGNDVYLFNPHTMTWRQLPGVGKQKSDGSFHRIPGDSRLCNIKFSNDYLYQWGGLTQNKGVFRYDLREQAWEHLESTSSPEPATRSYYQSTIKDGNWYIFSGWDEVEQKNSEEIWRVELNQGGSDIVNWVKMPIEHSEEFYEANVSCCYAFEHVEPYVYFHGGYDDNKIKGNFIANIDLRMEPLVTKKVAPTADFPKGRSKHSLTAIGNKLYMFGGSDGEAVLDEFWEFDTIKEDWSQITIQGIKPSRRMGHAATTHGAHLIIWGGTDGLTLFNDMYIFSVLSRKWVEMEVRSEERPEAAEGAWIVAAAKNVYIYGGLGDEKSLNMLWQYNINTSEYKLLTHSRDFQQPTPTSYHQCYLYDDQLVVMLGITDALFSPDEVKAWDFQNNKWNLLLSKIDSRSQTISDILGDTIIWIGGSKWNNRAYGTVSMLNLKEKIWFNVEEWTFKPFASAGAYYGNSIYSFGGGGSDFVDGSLIQKHASDVQTKYTLGEQFPCSKGTYKKDGDCVLCPRGTYKQSTGDQECEFCTPGFANNVEGADHPQFCQKCGTGTYNLEFGSAYCYEWPMDTDWGTFLYNFQKGYLDDLSLADVDQPDIFESETEQAKKESGWLLTVIVIVIIILAIILPLAARKRLLMQIDMFELNHNYKQNSYMQVKQTKMGGLFTIIFALLVLYIIGETIIYYVNDNVSEVKTLIPIVVVNQNWGNIRGKLEITVILMRYGGQCVIEDNQCHEHIKYSTENIEGELNSLSCDRPEEDPEDCEVFLVWEKCQLQALSILNFSFHEISSYAGTIKVQISAESSIPDEKSNIEYTMALNDPSEMFIGHDPSIFSFLAIASIFESEISGDPAETQGYHMTQGARTKLGSYESDLSLGLDGYVNVRIELEGTGVALYTQRTYKMASFTIFLGLMGSIAGVMGAVVATMRIVETISIAMDRRQKRLKAKEKKKIRQNYVLKEYYHQNLSRQGTESFEDWTGQREVIRCRQEENRYLSSESQSEHVSDEGEVFSQMKKKQIEASSPESQWTSVTGSPSPASKVSTPFVHTRQNSIIPRTSLCEEDFDSESNDPLI